MAPWNLSLHRRTKHKDASSCMMGDLDTAFPQSPLTPLPFPGTMIYEDFLCGLASQDNGGRSVTAMSNHSTQTFRTFRRLLKKVGCASLMRSEQEIKKTAHRNDIFRNGEGLLDLPYEDTPYQIGQTTSADMISAEIVRESRLPSDKHTLAPPHTSFFLDEETRVRRILRTGNRPKTSSSSYFNYSTDSLSMREYDEISMKDHFGNIFGNIFKGKPRSENNCSPSAHILERCESPHGTKREAPLVGPTTKVEQLLGFDAGHYSKAESANIDVATIIKVGTPPPMSTAPAAKTCRRRSKSVDAAGSNITRDEHKKLSIPTMERRFSSKRMMRRPSLQKSLLLHDSVLLNLKAGTDKEYEYFLQNRIKAARYIRATLSSRERDMVTIGQLDEMMNNFLTACITLRDRKRFPQGSAAPYSKLFEPYLAIPLSDMLPAIATEPFNATSVRQEQPTEIEDFCSSGSSSSIPATHAKKLEHFYASPTTQGENMGDGSKIDASDGDSTHLSETEEDFIPPTPLTPLHKNAINVLQQHPCGSLISQITLREVLSNEASCEKFEAFMEEQLEDPTGRQRVRASLLDLQGQLVSLSTFNDSVVGNSVGARAFGNLLRIDFPSYVQTNIADIELADGIESAIKETLQQSEVATLGHNSFVQLLQPRNDPAKIMPHSFCLTDQFLEGTITFVSDGMVKLAGCLNRRQLLHTSPKTLQGTHSSIDRVLRLKNSISIAEQVTELIVNYTTSGTPFYNLLFLFPVLFENETQPIIYLGAHMDVTNIIYNECARRLLQQRYNNQASSTRYNTNSPVILEPPRKLSTASRMNTFGPREDVAKLFSDSYKLTSSPKPEEQQPHWFDEGIADEIWGEVDTEHAQFSPQLQKFVARTSIKDDDDDKQFEQDFASLIRYFKVLFSQFFILKPITVDGKVLTIIHHSAAHFNVDPGQPVFMPYIGNTSAQRLAKIQKLFDSATAPFLANVYWNEFEDARVLYCVPVHGDRDVLWLAFMMSKHEAKIFEATGLEEI